MRVLQGEGSRSALLKKAVVKRRKKARKRRKRTSAKGSSERRATEEHGNSEVTLGTSVVTTEDEDTAWEEACFGNLKVRTVRMGGVARSKVEKLAPIKNRAASIR
jgi:hypothetical protein